MEDMKRRRGSFGCDDEQRSCSNCDNVSICDEMDPQEKKEERQMRHWVIRWMVVFGSFITTLVIVSILYGYVFQERAMESEVTSGVLNNIFVVIKFMFE